MKAFKKILVALAGLLAILLGVAYLLPVTWTVERSTVINAPPSAIYPLISNLKTGWPQWSFFDNADPHIVYSYSGPEEGAGASRTWVSKKMGDGWQTIEQADPQKGVTFKLGMSNGFQLDGRMAFSPLNSATKVTWTDSGRVGWNPFYRYMAFFMDKMMGSTFEHSLVALKQDAEAVVCSHLPKYDMQRDIIHK